MHLSEKIVGLVNQIHLFLGNPVFKEDYPNDYYNDENIYDDNKNESNEIRNADGKKETIVRKNPMRATP